ncbi:YihY/virulence factor BrkB family protein [Dyadobacter sediminis]|uniref:YihY/virulence factor BrkB family protein n=2 Tax=Dyadobacter TaxID=120831 RepID=A0A5R9K4C4_9BACT|nr:YihY/virulence factor BrkB family protein [Dyadobacter sediminis]TLU88711.1 YihY/virulence factor BrkB family protein [Dyadobacter sediminis]GGC14085.1 hypothetical protein GCM10011325_46270 [Dyadobacter sediminis]
MSRINFYKDVLKESFTEFMEDNGLKLSAALSYYTVFSLAPMILVLISVVSIFFGREAFEGQLFGQIKGLVGSEAALQLQGIIKNAAVSNKSGTAAAIGTITLLIGATGVFAEIQDSINYIWSIKSKPQKGWLGYLKSRLLSFSVLITLGFLLIVSLGVNTLVDLLSSRLEMYFSQVSVIIFSVLNVALVIVIITALFSVIFKILPDGHVRWKECIFGAAFTAVLFTIGKFVISIYLGQSDLGAAYGASASIVILLTWIYYSSIILYFGAEFTKVYARSGGKSITPNAHAVLIIRKESEKRTPIGIADGSAQKPGFAQKLFLPVKNFIDKKILEVKNEITAWIANLATPVTYYSIIAVLGLLIVIVVVLLLGYILNRWVDSDYLGFVILLVFTLVLLSLFLLYRKKAFGQIKRLLMRLGRI